MKWFHKHIIVFEPHNPRSRYYLTLLTVGTLKLWEAKRVLSEVTQLVVSKASNSIFNSPTGLPHCFLSYRENRMFTSTLYQLLHSLIGRIFYDNPRRGPCIRPRLLICPCRCHLKSPFNINVPLTEWK